MSTTLQVENNSCVDSYGVDSQDHGAQNEAPRSDVSSRTKELDNEDLVFLTLGDGDFTYSLDLARYLKLSSKSLASMKHKHLKLILTGVDTLEELSSKYKDSLSILQQIRNQESEISSMSLSIQHGVNAIIFPGKRADSKGVHEAADHVLFHHPHLGTENCSLHKQFLAHLFHSVTNHWMKRRGGIFHLTLVEGQYDRWKCREQAERHGLVLLRESPFAPPPITKTNGTDVTDKNEEANFNRYHYRRHQTGKSFANRRPNSKSITYTFGRTIDKGLYVANSLPWQTLESSSSETSIKCSEVSTPKTRVMAKSPMLLCPFCDKEFLEKRSLKCHLRDKHSIGKGQQEQGGNGQEQLRKKVKLEMHNMTTTKNEPEPPSFPCPHCQPRRIFRSEKALQSHICAKHSGIYTYIAPAWSIAKIKETQNVDGEQPSSQGKKHIEECQICGFKLEGCNLAQHFKYFLPVDSLQTFSCDFCAKLFREERAKLQHMNFCPKRPDSNPLVN